MYIFHFAPPPPGWGRKNLSFQWVSRKKIKKKERGEGKGKGKRGKRKGKRGKEREREEKKGKNIIRNDDKVIIIMLI